MTPKVFQQNQHQLKKNQKTQPTTVTRRQQQQQQKRVPLSSSHRSSSALFIIVAALFLTLSSPQSAGVEAIRGALFRSGRSPMMPGGGHGFFSGFFQPPNVEPLGRYMPRGAAGFGGGGSGSGQHRRFAAWAAGMNPVMIPAGPMLLVDNEDVIPSGVVIAEGHSANRPQHQSAAAAAVPAIAPWAGGMPQRRSVASPAAAAAKLSPASLEQLIEGVPQWPQSGAMNKRFSPRFPPLSSVETGETMEQKQRRQRSSFEQPEENGGASILARFDPLWAPFPVPQ